MLGIFASPNFNFPFNVPVDFIKIATELLALMKIIAIWGPFQIPTFGLAYHAKTAM